MSQLLDNSVVDEILGVTEEMKSFKKKADQICGKCKSKDTRSEDKQTRSADEGMTNFVTCNNCGFTWKNRA